MSGITEMNERRNLRLLDTQNVRQDQTSLSWRNGEPRSNRKDSNHEGEESTQKVESDT